VDRNETKCEDVYWICFLIVADFFAHGKGPAGIFGPKRDEVTGGWRKLHNEELHNLYSSPSIIRMMKSRRMS
jgi:hypothetical protein